MIARGFMVGVLALACLTGCGILFPEEVNYFDGATVEVSPYGDVVALVNPKKFPKFLAGYEDRSVHLTPTLRRYFEEFDLVPAEGDASAVQPDGVVFVVHLNGYFVDEIQGFLDRGVDHLDYSNPLWGSTFEEVHAEMGEIRQSNRATTVNLRLDPGVGTIFGLRRNPPGPDSLLGYVMLPTNDLVGDRLLHEVTHFFGLYFDGPPVLRNMLESYGSHMGFASGGGLLGGWDELVEVDELTYWADVAPYGRGVAMREYSELELYAMGLLEAEAVAPIQVAVNPHDISEDEHFDLTFRVDGLAEVTIEQIVAANGVRPPRTQPLRLALVVLSDRTLTAHDWEYYHACTRFMSSDDPKLTLWDFFSEDQFPAHTGWWNWLLDPGEEFLNYHQATAGRGSIEVLKVE